MLENNRCKNVHVIDCSLNYLNTKNIKFSWNFNPEIENLPNTLTHLRFGWNFNQPIKNLSGTSLTRLKISQYHKQKLEVLMGCIIDRF